MATITECIHPIYNTFESFHLANIFDTEPKSIFPTMTQLNTFINEAEIRLPNSTVKYISDNFVEKYKSELRCQSNPLNKWMTLQPELWSSSEVIDWLYHFADSNGIDCSVFKAEAFQDKTGQDLCLMKQEVFEELDPIHGKQIFETFQQFFNLQLTNDPVVCSTENFYTDLINADNFGESILITRNRLNANENKDTSDKWNGHVYSNNNYTHTLEMGCHMEGHDTIGSGSLLSSSCSSSPSLSSSSSPSSSSSSSSGECSPQYCQPQSKTSTSQIYCPTPSTDYTYHTTTPEELPNLTHKPGDISQNATVVSERKSRGGRRAGQGSKGTHLWEFIRDLLHDDKFCPGFIKWEDQNMGVFRFVQSEAVAKMWGKKKNNTSMTYEKLSRAMRFCRSAGYFASLPKTSGFPKKLCFQFGPKSHGWQKKTYK